MPVGLFSSLFKKTKKHIPSGKAIKSPDEGRQADVKQPVDDMTPAPPASPPAASAHESKHNEERSGHSMDEESLYEVEDESAYDEETIDNSDLSDDLSSQRNCFAIRLNDERDQYEQKVNRLQSSLKNLCKRYPLFTRIDGEERLPWSSRHRYA